MKIEDKRKKSNTTDTSYYNFNQLFNTWIVQDNLLLNINE